MDDPLGAFCPHARDVFVAGAPGGPLHGLAFAAKDLYDVAGVKTGGGNPDWLATHDAPSRHAPVVQALLDAGANLAGKTLTDELAFSLNGENHHYGTPINVNAPGRIPGGSSSGSAAASTTRPRKASAQSRSVTPASAMRTSPRRPGAALTTW